MMCACADECDEFLKTKHLNGYRNEGKHGYFEAFLYTYCSEMVYSRFYFWKCCKHVISKRICEMLSYICMSVNMMPKF